MLQQQVIPYHHHIYLIAMIGFIVGNALHGLAQINKEARLKKTSMKEVFSYFWVPLLVRGVLCMFGFLLLLEGQADDIITAMHIPLPAFVQGLLNLNVNNFAIAGLAGWGFDSGLGYIPKIEKLGVPPAIDAATNGTENPQPTATKVDGAPPKV